MVTIALVGHFTGRQLEYALNSIFTQTYLELELIVSVNDWETSLDTVIRILNAHDCTCLKKIMINPDYRETQETKHLKYICGRMTGDYLLLLMDGACFYDPDTLRKCMDAYGQECFILGTSVVYSKDERYLGDIRAGGHNSVKDFLHQTLADRGGLLLPESFIKAGQFWEPLSLQGLEEAVWKYTSGNEKGRICISEEPLLKCYRMERDSRIQEESKKAEELQEFYKRNCSLTGQDAEKWKLNYFDGKKLAGIMEDFLLHTKQTEENLRKIDDLAYDLFKMESHSAWGMTDSGRALLCYLWEIRCWFLKKCFLKHSLKKIFQKAIVRNRIRVVFIVAEICLWNSCYKSIYDRMSVLKERFEMEIVYVPFEHPSIRLDTDMEYEKWSRCGLFVYHCKEYDLAEKSPDFIFICKPYEAETGKWRAGEIKSVCPHIIYIPYNMALAGISEFGKRLMFQLPVQYFAWKSLAWNKAYAKLYEENAFSSCNKLEIGHPKFDVSQKMLAERERKMIAEIKALADGRKIIFWNTSFILDKDDQYGSIFLDYGMEFFEYIYERTDVFLLWRPHPMFFRVLEQYGCYEDVMHKIKMFPKGKLYLDTGTSQWVAVFVSDLLVSDLSGIMESYILTKKPVIVTTKGKIDTGMDGVFYQSQDFQSLADTVTELLVHNRDPLFPFREKYLRDNYFLSETKSVADKLLEVIEEL